MYDAKAIGSGSEGAQSSLQEVYHKGITMTEAEEKLLVILKQVMEEKLNSTNVEVIIMCYRLVERRMAFSSFLGSIPEVVLKLKLYYLASTPGFLLFFMQSWHIDLVLL